MKKNPLEKDQREMDSARWQVDRTDRARKTYRDL